MQFMNSVNQPYCLKNMVIIWSFQKCLTRSVPQTCDKNVSEKSLSVPSVCASSVYVFRGNNWFLCVCVVPPRARPTSPPNATHTSIHMHKHSEACCNINETWIRHEERPPSYILTQGPTPLPSCFLSADYPAFTGLWLSGARKSLPPPAPHPPPSRRRHTAYKHKYTHTLPTVNMN